MPTSPRRTRQINNLSHSWNVVPRTNTYPCRRRYQYAKVSRAHRVAGVSPSHPRKCPLRHSARVWRVTAPSPISTANRHYIFREALRDFRPPSLPDASINKNPAGAIFALGRRGIFVDLSFFPNRRPRRVTPASLRLECTAQASARQNPLAVHQS